MATLRTINVFHDPDVSCPCSANHTPKAVTFDLHHLIPLSWGGPDTDENSRVICPTTHRHVHLLLTRWRKLMEEPSWEFRQHFGPFARQLAEEGFTRWQMEIDNS